MVRRRLISGLLVVSAVGAGLLVPAAAFAAEPTDPAVTPTCPDTHWPHAVQGKPTKWKSGGRAGDYLWHDRNGWHLRVTHTNSRKFVFTGRIVSGAPLTVTGVKLEKADWFKLSDDKKTLTYRFTNYGHTDGLDFKTDCAQRLRIAGAMNGKKLPRGRIWLGHRNVHPLSNPFVVIKVS
jgi:hypothetical protein